MNQDSTTRPENDAPPQPKKKKRRWLRRLIIFLVILLIIIGAAPYWLSTGPGRSLILSIANKALPGRLEMDDLSLSWTGPITVEGVRLYDLQDRRVISLANVNCENGILDFASSPQSFGDIELTTLEVDLYIMPDGQISLLNALPETKEKKEKKRPTPRGMVQLSNARVRVVQPDGRELIIHDIQTEWTLATLDDIKGQLSLAINHTGKLTLEAAYRKSGDQPDIQVAFKTPQAIDLQPLATFAGLQKPLDGRLHLDGRFSQLGKDAQGKFLAHLRELQSANPLSASNAQPVNLTFETQLQQTPAHLACNITLGGDAGELKTILQSDIPKAAPDISKQDILDMILTGRPLTLPKTILTSSGQLDLARLAKALPALMTPDPNVQLTGGVLELTNVGFTTQPTPQFKGAVGVKNVSVLRTDSQTGRRRTIRIDPIMLALDAVIQPNQGLNIRTLQLQSAFANANGQGTLKNFTLNSNLSLAQLRQQLNKLREKPTPEMRGSVNTRLTVQSPDRKQFNINLTVTGNNISVPRDNLPVELQQITANLPITLQLKDNALAGVKLAEGTFTFAKGVSANLNIDYAAATKQLTGRFSTQSLQLKDVDNLLRTFGKDALKDYRGALTMAANFDVNLDTQQTAANVTGNLADLTVAEVPALPGKPLTFAVANVAAQPKNKKAAVKTVSIQQGEALNVAVDQLDVNWSDSLSAAASINVKTDLAYIRRLLGAKLKPDQLERLAGSAEYKGDVSTSGDVIQFVGKGGVSGLTLRANDPDWGPLRFDHDTQFDRKRQSLTFKTMALTGRPFNVTLKPDSRITDLKDKMIFDMHGHFNGSWDKLMPLIYALSPTVEKKVGLDLKGALASGTEKQNCDFSLTGPAKNPKLAPEFRDLKTQTALGWKSGELLGMALGEAAFAPKLNEGRLTFGAKPFTASEGTINVDGYIQFDANGPAYHLPGKVAMIDKIHLNPEVGEKLLSRINPIFAKTLKLDGLMTLQLEDMNIPLDKDRLKKVGRGKGQLDLSQLAFKPGEGPLSKILTLGGTNPDGTIPIRTTGVKFEIKDSRVYYDDFTLILGKDFDLTFSGWVGFDESMELSMSVPIRAGVLEAVGLPSAAGNYLRMLETLDARIVIPIKGSNKLPRLDLKNTNINALLKKAGAAILKQQLQKGAEGGLRDILRPSGQTPKNDSTTEESSEDQLKKEAINLGLELLKGLTKEKEEKE